MKKEKERVKEKVKERAKSDRDKQTNFNLILNTKIIHKI